MMPQIPGTGAEENDNDPVEVRSYQILGSNLDYSLGEYPVSNIMYDTWGVDPNHYWQYYPNGMIVSSMNTCACVIFSPIADYYATVGQFQGPLGSPSTDVTYLPDTTSYVVFEFGVLWVDLDGTVHQLSPMSQSLLQGYGVDPSIAGITQLAQTTIQDNINAAFQSNSQLRNNVSSITASVVFDSLGNGGCLNAGFNNPGTGVGHSHIFSVHLDISLSGCAGVFGGASADLHITILLYASPPNTITATLVGYTIDNVSSPGGVGNSIIQNSLSQNLNAQQGQNLLNITVPNNYTLLAALPQPSGDVDVFIEPLCLTSTLLRRVTYPSVDAKATLAQIRRLRDEYLSPEPHGRDLIQVVEAFGPVLAEAIREQSDAAQLRDAIARFLISSFPEGVKLGKLSRDLLKSANRMHDLISAAVRKPDREILPRLISRTIAFIRQHLSGRPSFSHVTVELSKMLEEETKVTSRKRKSPKKHSKR